LKHFEENATMAWAMDPTHSDCDILPSHPCMRVAVIEAFMRAACGAANMEQRIATVVPFIAGVRK